MTTLTTPGKRVAYDRETRDFSAFYNDEYLGSRSTRLAAEALCDAHVFSLLQDGQLATPGDLASVEGATGLAAYEYPAPLSAEYAFAAYEATEAPADAFDDTRTFLANVTTFQPLETPTYFTICTSCDAVYNAEYVACDRCGAWRNPDLTITRYGEPRQYTAWHGEALVGCTYATQREALAALFGGELPYAARRAEWVLRQRAGQRVARERGMEPVADYALPAELGPALAEVQGMVLYNSQRAVPVEVAQP